jgi:hypothetical protein
VLSLRRSTGVRGKDRSEAKLGLLVETLRHEASSTLTQDSMLSFSELPCHSHQLQLRLVLVFTQQSRKGS